jgi:hypothetical protein
LRLSHAEVAERLGIKLSAYAKLEAQMSLPKPERQTIAAALGIALEQLDG